jgi:hypothetical protein
MLLDRRKGVLSQVDDVSFFVMRHRSAAEAFAIDSHFEEGLSLVAMIDVEHRAGTSGAVKDERFGYSQTASKPGLALSFKFLFGLWAQIQLTLLDRAAGCNFTRDAPMLESLRFSSQTHPVVVVASRNRPI